MDLKSFPQISTGDYVSVTGWSITNAVWYTNFTGRVVRVIYHISKEYDPHCFFIKDMNNKILEFFDDAIESISFDVPKGFKMLYQLNYEEEPNEQKLNNS